MDQAFDVYTIKVEKKKHPKPLAIKTARVLYRRNATVYVRFVYVILICSLRFILIFISPSPF